MKCWSLLVSQSLGLNLKCQLLVVCCLGRYYQYSYNVTQVQE